ncbi:putative ribonuclease H protein, partial [Trifolium medium]|nr:putative ribonuclease H protein [Trifolium medium]
MSFPRFWKASLLSLAGIVKLVKSDINSRKIVIVALHKVCTPILEGGLGIMSLRDINEAATVKLGWKLLCSQNQWPCFLRSRFLRKIGVALSTDSSLVLNAKPRILFASLFDVSFCQSNLELVVAYHR